MVPTATSAKKDLTVSSADASMNPLSVHAMKDTLDPFVISPSVEKAAILSMLVTLQSKRLPKMTTQDL